MIAIDFERAKSWVESANDPSVGFPLQSLPWCSFKRGGEAQAHLGVGVGTFVLDLNSLCRSETLVILEPAEKAALLQPQLNAWMACEDTAWRTLRFMLMMGLMDGEFGKRSQLEPHLISQSDVRFCMPVAVSNYTDFYSSVHHATNVGMLFRPEQPLLPNYKWVPIGYHGRASSLVISGTGIRRPFGQVKQTGEEPPAFCRTTQLDYELEVAAYVGAGNPLGEPVQIGAAEFRIFGISLMNDWSARDIQSWEYQPLGPFLGKSFATSISPWVVTMDALEAYRVRRSPRPEGDPEPLAYLTELPLTASRSGLDVQLEVHLSTARMRAQSIEPVRLSSSNLRDLYWSFGQMVAHHTSNGCNLVEGDLLASGTVSGPDKGSEGCLLEMTRRGAAPIRLPNGEARSFLEDGDEVILRGFCERNGFPRISLGECRGTILPAHPERLTGV